MLIEVPSNRHFPADISMEKLVGVSHRLRALLDKFFQGSPTSTDGVPTAGYSLVNSRYQSAQRVEQALDAGMKQASGTISSEHITWAWKMRHAIYWYSVVSSSCG